MIITAIKAAVKTEGRFNVFVDGAYSFSLDEKQLIDFGVHRDMEMTASELEQLQRESIYGKAYARALEYIFRRPRSQKEIRDYGWRKKWEPAMVERIIERMTEQGYLDDQKFAESWVRHRAYGKPTSRRKIILELRTKGVDAEYIEAALASSEEYIEQDELRALIEKKKSRYPDRQKLMMYLASQGFGFEDIKNALDQPD